MTVIKINTDAKAIIRAAVNDRYGDGTSEALDDYLGGHASQDDLARRWDMTQQGVSRRLNRATTLTRRLMIAAGMLAECEKSGEESHACVG